MSSGTLEAQIVAVRWTCHAGGCRYLEAYENEELFWDSVAECGAPERAYRLKGEKLVEWDYQAGLYEMRADAEIDRRHRDARRAVA